MTIEEQTLFLAALTVALTTPPLFAVYRIATRSTLIAIAAAVTTAAAMSYSASFLVA